MHLVRDILGRKPPKIVLIEPRRTVFQALLKLHEHGIGVLLVADDSRSLAGIVSERDIAKGAAKFGDAFLYRPIGDLMNRDLVTCDASDRVVDALTRMNRRRIRHLPVIDGAEVVGMISIRDMMPVCIEAMQSPEDDLERQLIIAAFADHQMTSETWLDG